MKFLKCFFIGLLYSNVLNAANYSFKNISINYLDWSKKTYDQTTQRNFAYLELEGGAGWDWGELYGFLDIENPTNNYDNAYPHDLRFSVKPVIDIYIKNGFAFHLQDFYFKSKSFYVSNLVTGFSYKYTADTLWVQPWIGTHYQNSTYYSGFNGYMAGWNFCYDWKFFGEDLQLFQWHEIEFSRDKEHYLFNNEPTGDSKSYGVNGALSLWWKINTNFTNGIQYRYATHKLGYIDYQDGIIYSLKYYY